MKLYVSVEKIFAMKQNKIDLISYPAFIKCNYNFFLKLVQLSIAAL